MVGLLLVFSVTSSFIFIFLITKNAANSIVNEIYVISLKENETNSCFARFLSGISIRVFSKYVKKLMKHKWFQNINISLKDYFELTGKVYDEIKILSNIFSYCIFIFLVISIVSSSVIFGFFATLACCVIGITCLKNKCQKYYSEMREQVPDVLRAMAACSRSGLSLQQTLCSVKKECKSKMGVIFDIAYKRMQIGNGISESLACFENIPQIPELKFVALSLRIQHDCGGSIGPILESARESVKSEIDLMRDLEVKTSQAKLSARIVTCMPFVLLALFSFMSPDFLTPFISSVGGILVLIIALCMQMAGIYFVRKMLKVAQS